ncbi:hypothetical protein N665_0658s0008 [Sinapis alba]|nr:hypothetical protein N665_0658s0008 [Sinapis alba]
MRKDLGRQDIEEVPCSGSSIMELKKRSHQLLTEDSSSELFCSKRQVVEIDGSSHMRLSPWNNCLVPRQLTDCLFDPANAQHSSINIAPIDRQYIEERRTTAVPSIGSSFDLDASRKVRVNQVCESQSMLQFVGEGISTCPSYDSGTLSFGQTCSNIDKSFILPGPFTNKADGNFFPNFSSFDKGDENVFSTFQKGADCNLFSMNPSYNKGHENVLMSLLPCDKVSEDLLLIQSSYHKDNDNVLSGGQFPQTEGSEMAFMVSSQDRPDQNNDREVTHEDRSNTISFVDYQRETTMGSNPVRVINSYENYSHAPATANVPLYMEAEENMSFEFRNPPYAWPGVDTLLVPKIKDSKTAKRGSTNTFPSNVKSLLSTGMLDGVSVKYYSWSREVSLKNLKGIIKGTGYLCGCGDCNLNKVLNAYFENGKTIYGVVQELKNTPQEKLFDAIQNVTGSVINHKNYNTWKASYQVASLELQRIYGKDAVSLVS